MPYCNGDTDNRTRGFKEYILIVKGEGKGGGQNKTMKRLNIFFAPRADRVGCLLEQKN